jgi:two-component system LytT family sensor kinase
MSKKQNKDSYKYFRFIILAIIFVGFYLLAFMIDPYRSWAAFFNRDVLEILKEWFFVLMFCIIITEISLFIARKMDGRLPWVDFPITRFLLQFSIQIVATIAFLYVYMHATLWLFGGETKFSDLNALALRQSFVVSVLLSIMISVIYTGNYFLEQWKEAMLESSSLSLKAAELKQIALEAELESLKMQLDPHFMFNNFSTLSALITEDQNAAQHFLENLSRVYRYMIVNVHKNIVSVDEEIKFAKAYFYLIKIRLGENIKMQIDLNDSVLKKGIPPITLQLLLENAIKHNTASRSKPLIIRINEDYAGNLIIENSLQRLSYNIPSTCTGLKNIESRYQLLSNSVPEVVETAELFIVKLPLMDL